MSFALSRTQAPAQSVIPVEAPHSAGFHPVSGAHHPGQELAPQASGLIERLNTGISEVVDLGDLPTGRFRPDPQNPKQQSLDRVCRIAKQTAERVSQAVALGAKFLVIGGDCTITLGVLAGVLKDSGGVGLLYFDGEIDLNIPADSLSGILTEWE